MSVQQARQRTLDVIAQGGRALLHSNFPDEFEYYSVGFELIDHNGKTIDLLILPILPSSLAIQNTPNVNIKKSGSGVAVLFNSSFQPYQISLSGNFGRRFRFIVNGANIVGAAFRFNFKGQEFDTQIKTGYGVTKALENMLASCQMTDDNQRPFKLIFHNMAFNKSNVVEVVSYSFSQNDSSSNMIWNYSVNLKAITPSSLITTDNKSSLTNLLALSSLQSSLNRILQDSVQAAHDFKSGLISS